LFELILVHLYCSGRVKIEIMTDSVAAVDPTKNINIQNLITGDKNPRGIPATKFIVSVFQFFRISLILDF
jgi:hypothetical protein